MLKRGGSQNLNPDKKQKLETESSSNNNNTVARPIVPLQKMRYQTRSQTFRDAAAAALKAHEAREAAQNEWWPKVMVFDFDLTATQKHTNGYPQEEHELLKKKGLEDFQELEQDEGYLAAKQIAEDPAGLLKEGFLDYIHALHQHGTIIMFATVGSVDNVINCVGKAYKQKFGEELPLVVDQTVFGRKQKFDEDKDKFRNSFNAVNKEISLINQTHKKGFFDKIIEQCEQKNIKPHEILVADDSADKLFTAVKMNMAGVGVVNDESSSANAAECIESNEVFKNWCKSGPFSLKALQDAVTFAEENQNRLNKVKRYKN